jgi:APA family basic amino acid/polyamine antiporter
LALAVMRIGGAGWANLIAAFALIKILGTMSGITLANAEVARATIEARPFAQARDPKDRARTPTRILLWTAAGASLVTLLTTSPTFGKQFEALVDLSAIWTLIPYLFCAVALALIARGYRGRVRWVLSAVVLVASVVTGGVLLTATELSFTLTAALVAAIFSYQFLAARRRWKTA